MFATPALPFPPWVLDGQLTVLDAPSFQPAGSALARNVVKFWVVPELSERWATVMAVLGRLTPGLSAAMVGSFHFVTCAWKIFESVVPENFSWFETPLRL